MAPNAFMPIASGLMTLMMVAILAATVGLS